MSAPDPCRRARPLPPDERRRAIVDAVSALVVEHGRSVTSRQLAETAGVSEGTIFKAFGTKEDLLAAVAADRLDPDRLERELEAATAAADDDRAALAAQVAVLQDRSLVAFRLATGLGHELMPHRHPGPMPVSDALVRFFAGSGLALRGDAERAARTLRAVAFSQSHPFLVERPEPPDEVVTLFLHGFSEHP